MVSNDQELVYSEPISILEITKDQEHTVIVMDTESTLKLVLWWRFSSGEAQ